MRSETETMQVFDKVEPPVLAETRQEQRPPTKMHVLSTQKGAIMEISGDYRLRAPREQVWAALNDPEYLRRAMPGCEELTKLSDNEFEGRVESKIGPVKAKFNTKVTLVDLNPPVSYTITGEGKGGAAGFAKGSAEVVLEEDGAETILRYTSKFQVGGKLAQIGNRLVGGAARKTADDFFSNFAALLNTPEESAPAASADADPLPIVPEARSPAETDGSATHHAPSPRSFLFSNPLIFAGGALLIAFVLLFLLDVI